VHHPARAQAVPTALYVEFPFPFGKPLWRRGAKRLFSTPGFKGWG